MKAERIFSAFSVLQYSSPKKIKSIFALYQPGYRSHNTVGEESPDSKGQHTG